MEDGAYQLRRLQTQNRGTYIPKFAKFPKKGGFVRTYVGHVQNLPNVLISWNFSKNDSDLLALNNCLTQLPGKLSIS